MTMPGALIVLEGIDGSGTTTQAQLLTEELRRRGRKVVQTREPYDVNLTKRIRVWLAETEPPYHAVLLAFALDRQIHLRECILPALKRGEVVVCDRYTLSTLVYQVEHNDRALVRELCGYAPAPDLTILLDLPVEEALARVHKRGAPVDVYERDANLQRRVALAYRRAMAEQAVVESRAEMVMCSGLSILDTHAEVLSVVEQAGIV